MAYPEKGDHYWWKKPNSGNWCHWCGVAILNSQGESPPEAARRMWGPDGNKCKNAGNIEERLYEAYERFDSGAEELIKAFACTSDGLLSRMLNKMTKEIVEG